jgi:GNAT superfamily N-acetyltransferase
VSIAVRQASMADVHAVSYILMEAALWLEKQRMPLWSVQDLTVDSLRERVAAGLYILAEVNGQPAGTLRYQLEDPLFWPELLIGESAFVHHVAVRRDYAGSATSTALLQWAVDRTRALGRRHVRLDCDASRIKLRSVYERFGFQFHSERRIGPYNVARYEYPIPENAT